MHFSLSCLGFVLEPIVYPRVMDINPLEALERFQAGFMCRHSQPRAVTFLTATPSSHTCFSPASVGMARPLCLSTSIQKRPAPMSRCVRFVSQAKSTLLRLALVVAQSVTSWPALPLAPQSMELCLEGRVQGDLVHYHPYTVVAATATWGIELGYQGPLLGALRPQGLVGRAFWAVETLLPLHTAGQAHRGKGRGLDRVSHHRWGAGAPAFQCTNARGSVALAVPSYRVSVSAFLRIRPGFSNG